MADPYAAFSSPVAASAGAAQDPYASFSSPVKPAPTAANDGNIFSGIGNAFQQFVAGRAAENIADTQKVTGKPPTIANLDISAPASAVTDALTRPITNAASDALYNAGLPAYQPKMFGTPGTAPTRQQSRDNLAQIFQGALGLVGSEEGGGNPVEKPAPIRIGAPAPNAGEGILPPRPIPTTHPQLGPTPEPAAPAGAPPMAGQAQTARPPWMPTDDEIDAAGLPSSAPPSQPPQVGTPSPSPQRMSPPQSAPAPNGAQSSTPPTIGGSTGMSGLGPSAYSQVPTAAPAGGSLARVGAPTRKAAEIIAREINANPDSFYNATPWQTTAEALGGNSARRLEVLGGDADLNVGPAISSEVGERMAGIPNVVRNAAQDAFGIDPTTAMDGVRQYVSQQQALARPLYEDLRDNTGPIDSPALRELLQDPVIKKYVSNAAQLVHAPDNPAFHTIEDLQLPDALPSGARAGSALGRRPPTTSDDAWSQSLQQADPGAPGVTPGVMHVNMPTFETWDVAHRLMNDDVQAAIANGDKTKALYLQRKVGSLIGGDGSDIGELDRLIPKYKAARVQGGLAPSAESVTGGAARMFAPRAMTNDEFAQAVNGRPVNGQIVGTMSPEQKRALLSAEMARVETILGAKGNGGFDGNVNLSLLTSPNYEKRLGMLAGPKAAGKFVGAITDAEASRRSAEGLLVAANSKTFSRAQAAQSLSNDTAGMVPRTIEAMFDPGKAAIKAAAGVAQRVYDDKVLKPLESPVRNELGRLYMQSPTDTLRELQGIKGLPKIKTPTRSSASVRGGGRASPPKLP